MRNEKGQFVKGNIPPHKGKKGLILNSGKTCFKKKDPRITGQNHHFWKGENVSYVDLHKWIERERGIPIICDKCGKKVMERRKIQWANISGKYKRDIKDYMALCGKCHFKYDRQDKRERDWHGRFI